MAQTAINSALARLEDEAAWDVLVKGAEYGARSNSRGAAMRGLSLLGRRFEHRKMEAVEHFRRFAQETRGTPAAVFRGKLGAIQSMSAMADISAVPILNQLADQESDGRLRRRAEETVTHLFESAKKPQELKAIRSELDDVSRENKSLRERLDSIEKNQEAASKNKGKKRKIE
jgi:aminopeptidase N